MPAAAVSAALGLALVAALSVRLCRMQRGAKSTADGVSPAAVGWWRRPRRASSFAPYRASSFERRMRGDPTYARPFSTTDEQPTWQLEAPSEPGSRQTSARGEQSDDVWLVSGETFASRLFALSRESSRPAGASPRGSSAGTPRQTIFSNLFGGSARDSSPRAAVLRGEARGTLMSRLLALSPRPRAGTLFSQAVGDFDSPGVSPRNDGGPALVHEAPGLRLSVSHAPDSLAVPTAPTLRVSREDVNFRAERVATLYA